MVFKRKVLHAADLLAELAVDIVVELLEEGFLVHEGSEGGGKGKGAGGGEVVEGGDEWEFGSGFLGVVVLLGGVLFN